MHTLNLGGLVPESMVDGPGIRFVVFAQGCVHNCPGCFNPDLQPFVHNKTMTIEAILEMIVSYQSQGVTFSGGDPFEQAEGFAELAEQCRRKGLSLWCYTGYRFETLLTDPRKRMLLEQLDVLVDGRFHQAEKDLGLKYRGSANQRLINVPKSLALGHIVQLDAASRQDLG